VACTCSVVSPRVVGVKKVPCGRVAHYVYGVEGMHLARFWDMVKCWLDTWGRSSSPQVSPLCRLLDFTPPLSIHSISMAGFARIPLEPTRWASDCIHMMMSTCCIHVQACMGMAHAYVGVSGCFSLVCMHFRGPGMLAWCVHGHQS